MDDMTGAGDEGERRRRLEGLRALAGEREREANQAQARDDKVSHIPAAPAITKPPRSMRKPVPRRFWLRVGAAALAVCVVVAGLLVWAHQARTPGMPAKPIPDPLAIQLDPQFSCPTEVAWSPDGQRVAVLGYRDCPNNSGTGSSGYQNGAIYVYDARGSELLTQIQLDTPVAGVAAPHATATAQGLPNVLFGYSDLIWSPDGRRLAVQYGALAQESGQYSGLTDLGTGLLLADWAKGTVQVYPPLAALPASNYGVLGKLLNGPQTTQATLSSFQPSTALRWDMRAGSGSVVQVPQAARYAWDASGTLQAATPLPASPDAPPGPASQEAPGKADGGASFTMWQAGWVNYPWHCTTTEINGGSDVNCCPMTVYYTASLGVTAAWSPDGRYLVQTPEGTLGALGKIAQSLAPSTTPAPAGGCADPAQAASLAQLPVRDPALAHVLAGLEAPQLNSSSPLLSGALLAWSPDGKRLAAGYAEVGDVPPGGLTVYDCASGKALATIAPNVVLAAAPAYLRARGTPVSLATPAWSPDSQRLALVDPAHSILLLLGAKSLGLGSR